MAFTFAGRYGPEIFEDVNRYLLKSEPIDVWNVGTAVRTTLYTSRTKAVAAANPFFTDVRGNGTFFADPGEYEIEYAGQRYVISVPMDSIEAQGDGPPTGPAGGALGGNYPDPAFAVDMATQAELNAALELKANLASPALTGNPTAPTQAPGNNTTRLANTAFVIAEIAALIASAPGLLNTLDELAAALGDDPNFATTITTLINARVAQADYDANTILAANADNTPLALTMGASTILARLAAGNIVAATPAQLKTLLAVVAADIADFNTAVRTNRLDQMAQPTAAVAMNGQKITGGATPTAAGDFVIKSYVDYPAWQRVAAGSGGPGFENSWVDYTVGTVQEARYRKNPSGDCLELEGVIKNGASLSVAFTLPVGFRPVRSTYRPIITSGGGGYALFATTGTVLINELTGSASALSDLGHQIIPLT